MRLSFHLLNLFLLLQTSSAMANEEWQKEFDEEIIISVDGSQLEGDLEAPKEDYQNDQESILDILFGKAKDNNRADITSPIENGILAPGEFEVNVPNPDGYFAETAEIRLLDKTIGKLYILDINVGEKTQFNELIINVLSCWNPKVKTIIPNSRALISIQDSSSITQERMFYGWIFADSHNANILEHPKFDVTLGICKSKLIMAEPSSE